MLSVPVRSKQTLFMSSLIAVALIAVALIGASSAHAQADNFLNGDGHDGTVTFTTSGTPYVPNAVAPVSAAVSSGASSVSIGTTIAGTGTNNVGFAANRLVMVYQSNGVASAPTSGSQTAYPLSNTTAGHWEFGRLLSATATTLTFTSPLINSYAVGTTQVIAVPEYNGVTIQTGATISPPAWNGTTGGVVAFLAQGTLNVAGTGTVSAVGRGFRGGLSYVDNVGEAHNCSLTDYDATATDGFGMKGEGFYATAYGTSTPGTNAQRGRGNQINAGGGGNCFNGGGGGGGNVGQGGQGGNTLNQAPGSDIAGGGLGGAALTYNAYQRMPMGGGGGQGDRDDTNSGAGGAGGGVVYVRGGTLSGTGTFTANGSNGTGGNNVGAPYDGAGGAGAGGSVVLRFVNAAACTAATATGGTGGGNGSSGAFNWTPGGGGAGGAVYVQGSSVACTRTVTGGARGTGGSNNGATAGGNGTATANTVSLTKPVVALTTPANGSYQATTTPSISGTATNSSTVYIYIDGVYVTTTSASGVGAWSYTPAALSQGSHTVMVFSDVNGSQSDQASSTFTIDSVAPTVSLTAPANGSYVTTTTPTVTFSVTDANAGTSRCIVDGVLPGTVCTSGSALAALSQGSHTIQIQHTDLAGNVGSSATNTFTVDSIAPSAPAITTPSAATTYTNLTANTIAGTAEANSTVRIYDGVTLIATVTANGSGNWTYPATLAVGSHTITATATDAAGNVSPASGSKTIIVDQTAPAAPVITTPSAATTYTSDNTPNVGGTAEAGASINIYDGATLCGATIAVGGNWNMDICTLSTGSHTITAYAIDAAGNTSPVSNSKVIVVDTTAPTVSLTAPANGSVVSTATPTVTFSVTETNPGTSRCIVDGVLPGTVCTSGSALPALTDGSHTITIQHTDLAGNVGTSATNTFSVDTVAPVAPNISTPATSPFPTNDTTPLVAGTAEANSTVRVYEGVTLLGTTTADGSGNWSLSTSVLSVGSHTVIARSTDAAGNVSPDSTSKTIVIDTTAPVVNVTSPASNGLTVGPNGNITFTTSDAVGPVTTTCQMDSGTIASCTSPYAYSSLSNGSHTFTVTATDAAGNSATAVRTFTVDAVPPNTNITANPAAVTNSTGASFSFTSTESPSTFECQLDGGTIATCTTPKSYTGLTEGSHTFSVRAIDQYGNVDQTPASYTWTIDTTAPIAPAITTPSSDGYSSTTTPAVGGLAEPNSTVKVYEGVTLIGTATADGSGNWSLSPNPTLANGTHVLFATSTDAAGNVSPNSGNRTITVDTVAPTVTLTAPADGSFVSTATPAVTFSVTDNNPAASSLCIVDGVLPGTSCTTGFTTASLSDGSHTIRVSHTDLAGNVGTSVTNTFTVDTTAPDAPVITGGPSTTIASSSAAFTFTGEPGATYECYVDAPVNWVSCTSPANYSGLADGPHTFHVRQIDQAGNVSPESNRTWAVDTTGPPAPSVSGPTGTVGSSSATIFFNDTESPVTYMCKLDGGSYAPCTSPENVTGLANGPHSYSVYAIDTLGNAGSPTTINWTVDLSLFTVGITAGPLGTVATADNSLSFTATITSGTTYECKLDAGSYAACTSPFSTGALADGSHTFSVRAINGGDTSAPDTRTWTIDTAGPSLTINTPADGATVGPNGNVTFSATDGTGPITYTCQIDGDTAVSCGSPFGFSGLSDGPHSVTVVATDGVGNSSTVLRNFNVDAVEPDTTITDHPAADTQSTSATFEFSSNEPGSTFECSLDGGPVTSCTSPTTYTGLSEGTHTFSVRAIDPYGNYDQTPDSFVWDVDTTAPGAPSINTPSQDIYTADTTPAIGGLAEPNSTVKVYDGATLIGTATADGSGNWSLSPDPTLTEGPHDITATATDAAGNTSSPSSIRMITVDTTLPAVNISAPLNGAVVGTDSPDITFSATDTNLDTVQCSIDGSPLVNCSSPWATSNLSDGLHTVSVVATDLTGTNQTVASTTFTVDTTAPNAPDISTPPVDASTSNVRPTIGGTAEPNATIKVYDNGSLIGTTTSNGTGNWSFTPSSDLAEGAHPFTVTATDAAGNTSNDSNTRTITVDTTAPNPPVINNPSSDGVTNDATPTIGGTAEPNSTVTIYDDTSAIGQVTADGSGNWSFTPSSNLTNGAHPFKATATDAANNVSGDSNIRTLTIDTVAPTSTITGHPNAVDNDPTPDFTFTSGDGTATFECSIDGGTFTACTSPHTISPALSDGSHTFRVRAKDPAGNTESPAQSFTWTVDTTPPGKPVVTAPAANLVTNDNTPTLSGTAEPNSSVQVFVDRNPVGTVTANGSGNWTLNSTALTDGPHVVTARATDGAGNTGALSDGVDFTVDTTPPDGNVVKQSGSGEGTGNPTFDISTTDGTATIRCALDGGASSPCSSPFTPSDTLAPGTHTLVVTFTDPAGNVTTRTITFVIAGAVTPPPTPDPTQCLGGGVVITNLFPKGNKATVSGFARQDLIGKPVTITYMATKKAVATATVAADGSFTTTFKAPPKKDWNKNSTKYVASSGSFKSKQTKLLRRTSSTVATYSGGKLTVSGTVTLPLIKSGGATIKAKTGCTGSWKAIGKTKFKPNGAFSFSAAYEGSGVIFVQVNAVIGNPSIKNKPFKTNSFVVPVVVK